MKENDWFTNSELGNRFHLGILLNRLGLLGEMVEIGVHRGEFAVGFLKKWKGSKYHGVDPWKDNLEGYRLSHAERGENREEDLLIAKEALRPFNDRVTLYREVSCEAVKRFSDESLDFVYIDGNHEQSYVEQDITLWYPKIKPTGIIAGHDIVNGPFLGVNLAVKKLLYDERGLQVNVIPGSAWSFYCVKP